MNKTLTTLVLLSFNNVLPRQNVDLINKYKFVFILIHTYVYVYIYLDIVNIKQIKIIFCLINYRCILKGLRTTWINL